MDMTVVKVEPGKKAQLVKIENSLKGMQTVVGGLIQVISPFDDDVALVCNEEGKMLCLPLNRTLQETGDIIGGTFFICGAPADAEYFDSLTKEQIVKYYKMFEFPEHFYLDKENGITSVQFNFDEEER